MNRRPFGSVRLYASWMVGLIRHRAGRLVAGATGVALAVGLLASLGAFLGASKATMTSRAVDTVAVDWQVETQAGADAAAVADQVRADSRVAASEPVLFATVAGFQSTLDGTTRTTGAGRVIGIDTSYRSTFPGELRDLSGAGQGVLLYQQTAANLGARPGDTISIMSSGGASVDVVVDGVVDLPQADSLFQAVGAPIGAQPQAPPDNVLILPTASWHQLFDPMATSRPDLVLVQHQIHVRLDHRLASDPAAAYADVTGQARNLEVGLAGAGLVGDNLGAALGAARADALYAQVLFLFLGTPGAVLAALLTATIAGSGHERRRREQALLRTRGASTRQLIGLGITESLAVGLTGSIVGLALAVIVGRVAFGTTRFGATTGQAVVWSAAAVAVGLVIAIASIALPARRDARTLTVVDARRAIGRAHNPRWMRWQLDLVLIALAVVVFWLTSRGGYRLVLAVEGVPSISVSYWAFAGPALLWAGAGLLTVRLTTLALGAGRPVVGVLIRPLSGRLAGTVAASLGRQRLLLARGAALVALTIGFAASTAVFNSTYRQQAEVDAVLTNGADVTVTTSPGTEVAPDSPLAASLAATPGVDHVEAIQHRFAYVGADLQDIYGVTPSTIVSAGRLQDAYFRGGSAHDLIGQLATHPDGVLVSAETVHDFQLRPGDQLTLRLQNGATKDYVDVTFHYVGVVTEFPTAPRDSFLVANADYIAHATGSDDVGAFLLDTGGRAVTSVADQVRHEVGTSATVTDIVSSRRVIGSSLTAVDLGGLTRVELGFALALAAAATGLTMWLGLNERRRTLAIVGALGATPRQLGGFVWAEAGAVSIMGLLAGGATGWALAEMLVKVLRGVFDPAPARLAVPWTYLGVLGVIAVMSTIIAASTTIHASRRPRPDLLRSL